MRLFFYLWKVQGASACLKEVSATRHSLHRAVAGTLGTNCRRGSSALTGTEGHYLSVTHRGRLPSQGTLSAQQSTEDQQGHLPTSLLLSRRVPMPSIKNIIGRDCLTAQQVGSRTRQGASSTWHPANPKASSPNRVICFKPS